jgi:aminoglycoside phosphotransferase (APT) family kinase protein
MSLSSEQLQAILTRALPDERLRESRALGGDRYSLSLADGERLCVHVCATREGARTAAEALRLLRGEVDLPIPALRASDAEGQTIGLPYLLTDDIAGQPLVQVVGHIPDAQLYRIGRRIGETLQRVHRLACPRYGSLTDVEPASNKGERAYVQARLERDVRRCAELGLLDKRACAEVMAWFDDRFKPVGRQPALTHGALDARRVLVRQTERGWSVGGLLGWDQAVGWSPTWDHAAFLDAIEDPRFFSLRVGYGNGYDDLTDRAYEQVREHALAPYRALLMLERMQAAAARGDVAEVERRRGVLKGLTRVLEE